MSAEGSRCIIIFGFVEFIKSSELIHVETVLVRGTIAQFLANITIKLLVDLYVWARVEKRGTVVRQQTEWFITSGSNGMICAITQRRQRNSSACVS